jgi:elongation factor Ts
MGVSIEDIKKLKELTGVGLTDAKQALVAADGDFDKALEEMRKKGLTKAEKKGDRETREGLDRELCTLKSYRRHCRSKL